jgi:hypothetical protein
MVEGSVVQALVPGAQRFPRGGECQCGGGFVSGEGASVLTMLLFIMGCSTTLA